MASAQTPQLPPSATGPAGIPAKIALPPGAPGAGRNPVQAKSPLPANSRDPAQLERACRSGNFDACLVAGAMIGTGNLGPGKRGKPNRERGRELVKIACLGRHASACVTLALTYAQVNIPGRNLTTARHYFQMGCTIGASHGCIMAGNMRLQGRGGKRDPRGALQAYTLACGMKSAAGCRLQAQLVERGVGGKVDEAKSRGLYERACIGSDPQGCGELARQLAGGIGGKRDDTRARELADRACGRGVGIACFTKGRLWLIGRGGPSDVDEALEALSEACDVGMGPACTLGGRTIRARKMSGRDALRWLRNGCVHGDPTGCFEASLAVEGFPQASKLIGTRGALLLFGLELDRSPNAE